MHEDSPPGLTLTPLVTTGGRHEVTECMNPIRSSILDANP